MPSATRIAMAARSFAILSLLSTPAVLAAPSWDADLSSPHGPALQKRGLNYAGCYSSDAGLTSAGTYLYQTSSYCQSQCPGQAVLGLSNGNACYCGNSLPPSSSKVSDSNCNTVCAGFGSDKCGGAGFYTVYTTGEGQLVTNPDSSSSTTSASSADPTDSPTDTPSSSSTTSASPSVVTAPGSTVVITQPASTTNSDSSSSSSGSSSGSGGSNTTGVAVGVVVGLIALAAIIAGVFFYIRRRRQLAVEEEHRQRSQVSDFIAGGMERKNIGTSYSLSSDARLDPEAGRRNSVGSFMDDSHDYSRKILRVANPDD